VAGKVLYQGKPVPGGTVLFLHPKKGSLSSAIGEDGSYHFENIPAAEVKIAVLGSASPKPNAPTQIPPGVNWEHIKKTNPGVSEEALLQKMGIRPSSRKPAMSVPLPQKYGDPLQSGLTYTVTAGEQTHDIKLE
jgi:hypothetical protein